MSPLPEAQVIDEVLAGKAVATRGGRQGSATLVLDIEGRERELPYEVAQRIVSLMLKNASWISRTPDNRMQFVGGGYRRESD